uniref:Uncharacterized protein n=1 Tax=Chromera velia CCMP2878 TaxID=1169474 RepID=A0A0G4FB81_9ALVE|eukprot:Cvel_16032.t1-p1 / transcript=Cvel_16032.t1 / gene=Cvel_16032 / organism=Chromera_velia_CCMP2878 / gene_product=hypothetical protein / transcript_product=hypothetical protein / location=Cvel_scaffold1217:17792-19007(+) / protein_length=372 / sequence_SO=supercontig / SO=protein_coding / is_pseudo=false
MSRPSQQLQQSRSNLPRLRLLFEGIKWLLPESVSAATPATAVETPDREAGSHSRNVDALLPSFRNVSHSPSPPRNPTPPRTAPHQIPREQLAQCADCEQLMEFSQVDDHHLTCHELKDLDVLLRPGWQEKGSSGGGQLTLCSDLSGLVLDFLAMERHLHPVVVRLSRQGLLPFHMRRPDVKVNRITKRQWDRLDLEQMRYGALIPVYLGDSPEILRSGRAYREHHPAYEYRGFDAGVDGFVVVQLRGNSRSDRLTWVLEKPLIDPSREKLRQGRARRVRGEAPIDLSKVTLRHVALNPVAARRSRLWPSLDKGIALFLSAEPRKSILWEHTDAGLGEKHFWSEYGWRWRVYKYLPLWYTDFFYPGGYLGTLP